MLPLSCRRESEERLLLEATGDRLLLDDLAESCWSDMLAWRHDRLIREEADLEEVLLTVVDSVGSIPRDLFFLLLLLPALLLLFGETIDSSGSKPP